MDGVLLTLVKQTTGKIMNNSTDNKTAAGIANEAYALSTIPVTIKK